MFDNSLISTKRGRENILPQRKSEKVIESVFNDLSKTVSKTLGPGGGNTLITEPYGFTPIYPTKDGYKVMEEHNYDNVVYESIYRVIRDISSRMNIEIGDGTTSGVVIASDLYPKLLKYKKRHKELTPYGIKNILDEIFSMLSSLLKECGYIKDFSLFDKDEKLDIIKKVAAISANNDSNIGDKVAEIYKKTGSDYAFIEVKHSPTEEDILDIDSGFEFNSGYILRHMANKQDGVTAEYDDPLFLLIDGPIIEEDVDNLKRIIDMAVFTLGSPLVIIASEFCKEAMDWMVHCLTAYPDPSDSNRALKLPILAATLPNNTEYGISMIGDLETALGAKAIQTNTGVLQNCPTNPQELFLLCGRAKHIKCVPYFMRITGGAGTKEAKEARIEEIRTYIKQLSAGGGVHDLNGMMKIANYEKRIGLLNGEMHCIKVGGATYKEKQNRKLIYDDAVSAVKACIKNGITLGGNVSIYHCIHLKMQDLVDKITNNIVLDNKKINVVITDDEEAIKVKTRKIVRDILHIVAEGSLAAFKQVFKNAHVSKRMTEKVFDEIRNVSYSNKSYYKDKEKAYSFASYDLITRKMQFEILNKRTINENTLLVPGNTDIEIMKSVFSVLNLFLTSNQLMSLHTPSTNKRMVQK